MNNRLKQFLAAENITQAQFADNLNVVRASVSHVLSGRNNPGFDFIKAMMAKYPRLNIEWLIFGKGKMYKDMEAPKEKEETFVDSVELFPSIEPEVSVRIPETALLDTIFVPEQISNDINDLDNNTQTSVKQRKVSKILLLFDDGTFQEM